MSHQHPRGSIFAEGSTSPRTSIPNAFYESRRTTIYSQGIVIPTRDSTLDESPPITVKVCQQTNESAVHFKELTIERDKLPNYEYNIELAQRWLTLEGKNGRIHKFPLKTILPKVQMTRRVPAKQLPRDVEVDRRRRLFNKVDLCQELAKAGLSVEELLPSEEDYFGMSEKTFKHFLPLSFFDDPGMESHTPEIWLSLGVVEGDQRYPLPAKAFLPLQQSLRHYEWQDAAVSDYDFERGKWKVMILSDECCYEVPGIQIMFLAENPFLFVERLRSAVEQRNMAESQIMMETIADCVLRQNMEERHYYGNKLLERLMANVNTDEVFYQQLWHEIYLLFEHLMACYDLQRFVQISPKQFPMLRPDIIARFLPKAFVSLQSEKEREIIKGFKIDIPKRGYEVLNSSLYYTGGGIEAMSNVAAECLYIETLNLFICNFAKALPLADFLGIQQQQSTQVSGYLKNSWPSKLAAGIIMVLRPLGKGWLDIGLDKWRIYEMCKIFRFILQTKFRMQESMQVLLENSIETFTHFLSDPCLGFLDLDESYEWTSDFINSEFPYAKPIFSLVISVTEDTREVIYSTSPEEFPPALKEVFKKSLEKTSGVRCIDAETLQNLRFAPNLFILTVELIEDLYVRCNDLLQRCYLKAIGPLHSYARKYERFVEFYLLHVPTYMAEYRAAQKTSMQVKADILEHKRCKEEMREILPASISIGPFQVIVDPMKQYMIRKRIEIVKRIFEYYIDRMYDSNERLLERCLEIYNRINEKPQSIEHLFDIRNFALTIPELVEQLRADIQIMWLEYDMLDSFFYNLPDHQFAMKWEAYAWPKQILDRLSTLKEEQKLDIEEFKRLHLSECIGFEERLESLNDEIQQFSLQFNPKKVMETAVEVKKTWKVIQDLQKLGETLRYRQELFELEEFSLEFLASIIEGFLPYKNLWYACQDLVKLEEATVGNPIVNIELADVWQAMEVIKNSLNEALEIFNEKPEIQNVANYFLQVLDEFIPKYNAIQDLKNENWLYLHWQELGQRSGMDIKYSAAMNFQYCMRKGMMDHLELVHEISEKATNEADAIRQAWEEEERRKEEERQAILMRKAMRKCRRDIV
ncbi:dynein axonemal heavy chain 1 isoform X2 [Musca domestica]|uniref:Dynein heavy chain 1, axonemal n=1 Tax=Musca domestica TaxID=7370 RepID=A0A1I8NHN2_MUSDO|nr:dynein axonemal heavy chain 1 isoform X2 [Musca domestica]